MFSIQLICIGKLRDAFYRDAMAEYQKRLQGLCKFTLLELPEARVPQTPTDAEICAALQKEAAAILPLCKGTVLPLCIEGKQRSSTALADLFADIMQSPGKLTFVIGSSHGLDPAVKRAGPPLSMSAMTFPHSLARVMLTEQIYRALQILNGSKYHK